MGTYEKIMWAVSLMHVESLQCRNIQGYSKLSPIFSSTQLVFRRLFFFFFWKEHLKSDYLLSFSFAYFSTPPPFPSFSHHSPFSPTWFFTHWAALLTFSGSVTSRSTVWSLSEVSAFKAVDPDSVRQAAITWNPFLSKVLAAKFPKPVSHPVMKMYLSVMFAIFSCLL